MRVPTCFSMFPVADPEHLHLRLGASVHSGCDAWRVMRDEAFSRFSHRPDVPTGLRFTDSLSQIAGIMPK